MRENKTETTVSCNIINKKQVRSILVRKLEGGRNRQIYLKGITCREKNESETISLEKTCKGNQNVKQNQRDEKLHFPSVAGFVFFHCTIINIMLPIVRHFSCSINRNKWRERS